jgi:hypothetical protein
MVPKIIYKSVLFKGLYASVDIKHTKAPMHINYIEASMHKTCNNIYLFKILWWECDKYTLVFKI